MQGKNDKCRYFQLRGDTELEQAEHIFSDGYTALNKGTESTTR